MNPRERRDIGFIIGIAIAVVVALLIYIGISGWQGMAPD